MSSSLVTGTARAEIHAELEQSSYTSSRQPPATTTTAAARLPLGGPTLAPNYDRPTRRAQSLSARSSSSFRSLSPPVLSPAYVIDQPEPGHPRTVRAASSQRVVSPHARSQRALSMSPMFRPSLVDIWADADPTPLPRPAAGANVSASVGRTSLPYASVDIRRPGSAAAGPRLLEPATSVFAGASSAAVAHPGGLDVASSRTRVRSDAPMPLNDNVAQPYKRAYGMTSLGIRPTIVGVPRSLDLTLPAASDDVPPGNVDVAGPAYDPASLTVHDIACAPSPSSVVAPRPTGVGVHRPMPPMGMRQPKSSVPVDVVAPLSGPAPLMTDVGMQGLGGPTSVDDMPYPGPLSVSVGAVRQLHTSSMGADATRPMPVGSMHPPSSGAGIVGPTPAHVAHPSSAQLGSGVDVASRPTLADTRPRSARASQYAAVCTGVQVQTPVETLTAQSLLLLGRRSVSPESSPNSSVHEWLQASGTAAPPPSPAQSMSSSSSELQQVFASGAKAAIMVPPSARSSRASRRSMASSLVMELFGYSREMAGHVMQVVGQMQDQSQNQMNQLLAQAEQKPSRERRPSELKQ